MKQLKLRFARAEEAAQVTEWIRCHPENDFDPDILNYPTLQVFCSYSDEGPEAYIPTHNVKVLESTALKPDVEIGVAAQALRDFTKAAELMASTQNIRELYFLCRDEALIAMAKNHGYELMPFKVLRMKLK
jgi:hypothetical protein